VKIASLSVVLFAALVLTACGSDSIAPNEPPTNEPPTVTSISPAIGPLAGGTSVTITGTNFIDITDVTIGGIAVGNRTVVNSTQITGTTPTGTSAGGRDVVVNSSNHGWGVCGGCFVYHATKGSQITAGWDHTCALTKTGAAYCWGNNAYGSLGSGTTTNSLTPVAVSGGMTFTSIVAGGWYTCALTNGEDTYCWGLNDARQLGVAQPAFSTVPVYAFAPGFTTLFAGLSHTCGVTSYGGVFCWGANSHGELGAGFRGNAGPTSPSGGLTFISIDPGGYHTCGVISSGSAYCWGLNLSGGLGNGLQGTDVDALAPTAVLGPSGYTAIFAGLYHSCGLSGAGIAYCWGSNLYGGLGTGSQSGPVYVYCPAPPNTGACTVRPVPVAGGHYFETLALGGYHTCGLDLVGVAYCWGANAAGQLGNGSTTDAGFPMAVSGGLSFATIVAATGNYTCGITTTGAAYCWGKNDLGQLGNGTTNDSALPVAVAGLPPL
jgi:alpha-tubulin suppressor-like RCC1 family protein